MMGIITLQAPHPLARVDPIEALLGIYIERLRPQQQGTSRSMFAPIDRSMPIEQILYPTDGEARSRLLARRLQAEQDAGQEAGQEAPDCSGDYDLARSIGTLSLSLSLCLSLSLSL